MTKDEMSKIMNILFVAYPQSFKGWTKGQFSTASNLWLEMFKKIPYEIVMMAVKKELAENRTGFAPSIGQITYRVKELITVYDAATAWEDVAYMVRYIDIEDVGRHLKNGDRITQQIYSIRDIQRLKNTPGSLEPERPRFYAKYNSLKDKAEQEAVESGDLLSISDSLHLSALGVGKKVLMEIDMKGSAEDGQNR